MKPITILLAASHSKAAQAAIDEMLEKHPTLKPFVEVVGAGPIRKSPPAPTEGPGTELKRILESIGITAKPNCGCKAYMQAMNVWGVERCRQKRDQIVDRIRKKAAEWKWSDQLAAIASHPIAAIKLAAHVSWTDPVPGIVDLAIERAAAAPRQE